MCTSRSWLNLCECGCPEGEHEEPTLVQGMLAAELEIPSPGRGKCYGKKVLHLSIDVIKATVDRGEKLVLFEPCDCKEFRPAFRNICGGYGGGDPLGRKL